MPRCSYNPDMYPVVCKRKLPLGRGCALEARSRAYLSVVSYDFAMDALFRHLCPPQAGSSLPIRDPLVGGHSSLASADSPGRGYGVA